jgi:hypothetical protein
MLKNAIKTLQNEIGRELSAEEMSAIQIFNDIAPSTAMFIQRLAQVEKTASRKPLGDLSLGDQMDYMG